MEKKSYTKSLFIVLASLLFISCEDVVDIDLPTEPPRLVIEATGIQVENQDNINLTVKLSKTAPFFANEIPRVTGAEINVSVNNTTYPLEELPNGIYRASLPAIYNTDYMLNLKVDESEYRAFTQLYRTVPFDYIEQSENTFDPDYTSINAYFTDPAEEDNFYYFEFLSPQGRVLDNTDDELFNGNQVSTFYAEELASGDEVTITIQGISERFNNYFSIVLEQSDNAGGNPFSTAPATIRGNIVNLSNEENFPLGYFRISQQFSTTYTVQ